jgi:hypothetical protein
VTVSGSQWTTTGSDIYYNSGNVLVGSSTSLGSYAFQANGDSIFNGSSMTIQNLAGSSNSLAQTFIHRRTSSNRSWTIGPGTGTSTTDFAFGYDTGALDDILTLSNTGNVGIGTTNPTSKLEITTNSLATTQTNTSGVTLTNTTAASAGVTQQISPAIRWQGNAWASDLTSKTLDFRAYILPVGGGSSPTGTWKLQSSSNGGAYTDNFTVASNGTVTSSGSFTAPQLFATSGGLQLTGTIYLSGIGAGSSGQVLTSTGSSSTPTWTTLNSIATSGLSNGSGTTVNGTAVDLGGTLTANTTISGAQTYDIKLINNGASLTIPANGRTITIGDIDQQSAVDVFTVDTQNSKAYYDNAAHTGLFGINTTTPIVALDVLGASNISDDLQVGDINGDSDKYVFQVGTHTAYFDNTDHNIFFGINNNSPSVALDVTGDIEYTGTITDVSDERLKENITDFGSGLSIINSIGVKNYNMKVSPNKQETGFIAQNVQGVFPQAVSIVDPTNGYMGVSYVSFVPVLTKGIQELDIKIQGLSSLDTSNSNSLGSLIKNFLADIGNGLESIFVKNVHTNELCVKKSDNTEVCVTGDQLQELLNSQNIIPPPPPDPIPAPDPIPPPIPDNDITPPQDAPTPTNDTILGT